MGRNKEQKNSAGLLPFHIIKAATAGDVEAIEVVLKHYESHITDLSTRKMVDKSGQVYYYVDETLCQWLKIKLIIEILRVDPEEYKE